MTDMDISPSFGAGDTGGSTAGLVLANKLEAVAFSAKSSDGCVEMRNYEISECLFGGY